MEFNFQTIVSGLTKKKIFVEEGSLNKHHSKGFMSDVSVINSNIGKLIIHTARVTKEQERQRIWEKIEVVGNLLGTYPHIPAATILLTGVSKGRYFIVQKCIEGQNSGERVLHNDVIEDEWRVWSKELERAFEKHLAHIHEIPVQGYGWIIKKDDQAEGMHVTWLDFLEKETEIWATDIEKAEGNQILANSLRQHLDLHKKDLEITESHLVHADVTNPGNILVKDGKVMGIIDWEWALAGDPAWEFGFNNPCSLGVYFDSLKKQLSSDEKKAFLKRSKIYGPMFLFWVLHIHADTKNNVYQAARKTLHKLGFK